MVGVESKKVGVNLVRLTAAFQSDPSTMLETSPVHISRVNLSQLADNQSNCVFIVPTTLCWNTPVNSLEKI